MNAPEIEKIVLIGAGKVAWNLAPVLRPVQCFARNPEKAAETGIPTVSGWEDLLPDADLYLIAVSDDAIAEVSGRLAERITPEAIVAHTSGTTPLEALSDRIARRAVFYPLQTFTKHRQADFSEIPLLVEASDALAEESLVRLAKTISRTVETMDSAQRMKIHIAAVFACNFTQRLYALAQETLEEGGLSFDLLKPLIAETTRKVLACEGPVGDLQTGPAARGDRRTLETHLEMLAGTPDKQELYKQISYSINRKNKF